MGQRPEDILRLIGEFLHPDEQHVAQRVGESPGPTLLVTGRELLHEEGNPLRTPEDPVKHGGPGCATQDALQLLAHFRPGQVRQVDALDGAHPLQLGQEGTERMAAVQVVTTVTGDDDDSDASECADEVDEEFEGGPVRPVQVLKQQHHGPVRGQPFEETGNLLEQP